MYTVAGDPRVEDLIDRHMSLIVRQVRAVAEPRTILLWGSFGRGEGSVQASRSGEVCFFSDYEIAVVHDGMWRRRALVRLSSDLSAQTGVDTEIRVMRPACFATNQHKNLSFGRAAPSITMYELKSASRVLYGDASLLQLTPIDPASIPLREGLRLLHNRIVESLKCVEGPVELGALSLTDKQRRWITKLILACGDVLLLDGGAYHYSYRERAVRVQQAASRFQGLADACPGFARWVLEATLHRLAPADAPYLDRRRNRLSEVWRGCDWVLRHAVEQVLGLQFGAYDEFPTAYLRRAAVSLGADVYQAPWGRSTLYQNSVLLARALRARLPLSVRVLRAVSIPLDHIVYAVGPLLFLPLSTYGTDMRPVLHRARTTLRSLVRLPPEQGNDADEWRLLRDALLEAWYAVCY